MESFYYLVGARLRTLWCVLPIVRSANNAGMSGDLPSSAPQSIESRQENRASPMRAIIALLDDGRCEQSRRSTTPCEVSGNACQTREIWLAQQAAQAADQYLNTPDAKESQWRLVAQSIIKYSQARSEAYAAYVHARNQDPDAAEKAYHSIVDPLQQDFVGQLKAALRSDENSREIAQRFGLVDF